MLEKIEIVYVYNWASQVALVVKNPHANAGDVREAGLIPGLGRSLEEVMATHFTQACWENNPLQASSLKHQELS